MKRSTFVASALAALLLPFAASAQTDWPQKPVTLVVPYPPGGVNDAVARGYANKLALELGKPIVVENRAGAATTVASNHVARAPADGYTIYAAGTSLVINPTLTGQVQYDPHKSFDLVSLMSFTPFILHVNAAFPARTMAELIAHVKANPGKFNIASSGIGATNHLIAEMLKQEMGIEMTHVPYKGGAQAGQDVAGGSGADDVLGRARGQAGAGHWQDACARHHQRRAFARVPGHPDDGGSHRAQGLRGHVLARHGGACGYAPGHRGEAAEGDRQGCARPGSDRSVQTARGGDPRLLTGGIQGLHEPRRGALGEADQGAQHQAGVAVRLRALSEA
jgi:tripartite-type tricarboxylate transporter receptor subunit TctC